MSYHRESSIINQSSMIKRMFLNKNIHFKDVDIPRYFYNNESYSLSNRSSPMENHSKEEKEKCQHSDMCQVPKLHFQVYESDDRSDLPTKSYGNLSHGSVRKKKRVYLFLHELPID